MAASDITDKVEGVELDYQLYQSLVGLWSNENPIKTTKLQVLLAVNALLVSAVNLSGGIDARRWYVYAAGAIFSLIWTFSIGRTALFQDVWEIKIRELRRRYPHDARFSLLETREQRRQAPLTLRVFGAIPSRWYLLWSPFAFALAWIAILVISLR